MLLSVKNISSHFLLKRFCCCGDLIRVKPGIAVLIIVEEQMVILRRSQPHITVVFAVCFQLKQPVLVCSDKLCFPELVSPVVVVIFGCPYLYGSPGQRLTCTAMQRKVSVAIIHIANVGDIKKLCRQ